MHVKKIALVVEYQGTRYHGFQVQAQTPTVQQALEEAICRLTGERSRVLCASRTDAGAHALGQVVSFRTAASYPPESFLGALNHFLPDDIGVRQAYEIPMEFDVRKKATAREYRYLLTNRPTRSPVLREWAHQVSEPLDVDAMAEAAGLLLGEHDFASFAGPLTPKTANTEKRLFRAEVRRCGDRIAFRVAGNSFLHQQVRRMTGALVEVGLGKLTFDGFEELARCRKRGVAGPTLPACGLTLTAVRYESFPPAPGSAEEWDGQTNDEYKHKNLYP